MMSREGRSVCVPVRACCLHCCNTETQHDDEEGKQVSCESRVNDRRQITVYWERELIMNEQKHIDTTDSYARKIRIVC